MTTWADIQRLASDLQRVQLSQSAKKLSEANCIEVVGKLIQKSLIDVVFTRDGHSYVTNQYLATEVRNECLGLGGRASLTDIATSLNLDFDHVDRTARLIVSEDSDYVLSNGELFAAEYVVGLHSDLRSLLNEHGARTAAFLGKNWNLSQELLTSLVLSKLPDDFNGIVDGDTIYTTEYLQQHKNTLRAVLMAITKSTTISSIQSRVGLSNSQFWAAYDQLVQSGEVVGRLSGSRTSPSCSFIPSMFDALVTRCVQSSYRQNEYLVISGMKKLGLSEGKSTVQQIVNDPKLDVLHSIYISPVLLDHCITIVKDAVTKDGLCEVTSSMQALDIPFETADIDVICERVVRKYAKENLLTSSGFVYSTELLTRAFNTLDSNIESRAHEEVDRLEKDKKQQPKPAVQAKKVDDDDDWGDNKKGGKKKGVRGGVKGGKGKQADDDDEPQRAGSVGLSDETLERWLKESSSVPEEIIDVVVEQISSKVGEKLQARITELLATQQSATAQSQKKQLIVLEAKARSLYHSICTFEGSISSFSPSLSADLTVHVIRNIGAELAGAVLSHASGLENLSSLSEKQRDETISNLPQGPRDSVAALYESLKTGEFDVFHSAVEGVATRMGCGIQLRRPDEKRMSAWRANYILELRDSVMSQTEAASCLLSVVILLLAKMGRPTTASGKFVARLIAELEEHVPQSTHELLMSCQRGVVQCIKNKEDEVAKEMLAADLAKLKEIVQAGSVNDAPVL